MTMLDDPTPQDDAMERAAEVVRDEPAPVGGFFRQVVRDASDWRTLIGTPYGLSPLLIMACATFFVGMSGEILIIGSVSILRDLDISIQTIIGYLILAGSVSTVVFLGVAWWADRHSRSKVFSFGLIVGGAITAVSGAARSGLSLGTPLVVGQSTLGLTQNPTASLLADYYPPGVRGRAYAIDGLFFQFGTALSPLTVGALIHFYGWRATYVITAVAMMLLGVFALFRLREPIRGYFERVSLGSSEASAKIEDEPASFGEAWRTVWATRSLRRLFVADVLKSAGLSIYSVAAFIVLLPQE